MSTQRSLVSVGQNCLCVKNVRFFNCNRETSHSDPDLTFCGGTTLGLRCAKDFAASVNKGLRSSGQWPLACRQ